jgi:hypothetical protein
MPALPTEEAFISHPSEIACKAESIVQEVTGIAMRLERRVRCQPDPDIEKPRHCCGSSTG